MNIQDTKTLMETLTKRMVDQDFITPEASFTIVQNAKSYIRLAWAKNKHSLWNDESKLFFGENPDDEGKAAIEWIMSQPTKAERDKQYALELTAKAIEASRDAGFEPDYMSELQSMMKRLSENVIEGPNR